MFHLPRLAPILAGFALAFALAPNAIMTANAQTPAAARGTLISVSAEARASRAPDIATLSTGVVSQAADANAALRANAAEMQKVMSAIRAAGIAERDVQTSGVSLYPQYRYAENQPPAITGYQASNTVNLKVRDLGKLGAVLDALVASGANQINGPTFEIENPDPVVDDARRAALKKARARADMYAEALGLKVLRIVSIDEGSGFMPPQPMPMLKTARMEASDATPISSGENSLSATLNVVFELGQ